MDLDHHQVFKEFLLDSGQKYTTQRKSVVNEVFKIHDHFDIENFIGVLRKKNIKVARATIYSTIKLLMESKLIRKVRMSKGAVVYEHIFGHEHHDHLICINCDKAIEIQDSEIEDLQVKLCEKNGFTLESHVHTMYVKCNKFIKLGHCENKKGKH